MIVTTSILVEDSGQGPPKRKPLPPLPHRTHTSNGNHRIGLNSHRHKPLPPIPPSSSSSSLPQQHRRFPIKRKPLPLPLYPPSRKKKKKLPPLPPVRVGSIPFARRKITAACPSVADPKKNENNNNNNNNKAVCHVRGKKPLPPPPRKQAPPPRPMRRDLSKCTSDTTVRSVTFDPMPPRVHFGVHPPPKPKEEPLLIPHRTSSVRFPMEPPKEKEGNNSIALPEAQEIVDCLERGLCTFTVTRTRKVPQRMYQCLSCSKSYLSCESCAAMEHDGHTLHVMKVIASYCEEGASRKTHEGRVKKEIHCNPK